MSSPVTRKSGRLNLRTTEKEEALIKAAAPLRGLNASQYVLFSASKQAEMDLADRCSFTLSPEQMDAFLAALDRPVRDKPRLRELINEKTVLE